MASSFLWGADLKRDILSLTRFILHLYTIQTNVRKKTFPMPIRHIDAIARKKQRGVLYVTFTPLNYDNLSSG